MKKVIKLSVLILSAIVFAWCTTQTTPATETTTAQSGTTINSTRFTLDEVAMHATQSDCRTAINGNVYDITSAFGKHKWWDKALLWLCGIEWTESFKKVHWTNEKAQWWLATLKTWVLR